MDKRLKVIDLNTKSFLANGKEYFIESSLSFDRFQKYQMLQIEVGYEVGFSGLYDKVKKIYELCNEMKFADIAVLSRNILDGVKMLENRRIPVLEMCCLFINTKDENRKTITDDMINAKIKDWDEEGLDIIPFFSIAMGSIQGFAKIYQDVSHGILEEEIKNRSLNLLRSKYKKGQIKQ